MFSLRNYQERTVEAIRQKAISGSKRILVAMATGAGKTHTMAQLVLNALDKDKKVLALMHRRGLVDQMVERFSECGIDSGIIMAGKDPDLDRRCQVASLWTYRRRVMLEENQFNRWFHEAPFLIIDEAHHVVNKTYQKILEDYPDSFVVGFTATPVRATGAGLGTYFDSLVDVVGMDELMDGGYLVPGIYYGPSEPDLQGLAIVQGDYEKKGLDARVNTPKIVGDVVDNWINLASEKQTMIFAINRKHGKALCNEFISRGVNAEYLDAHNDDDERNDVLGRFRQGDTQVICQVALYTEGTDIPEIECLVIARPTRSLGLHRQILGRGARPQKGKQNFTILDHGGNIKRLGFYEDEINWVLDEKKESNIAKKPRLKEKTIIDCPMCSHLFTGPRCTKCGYQIKNYAKKIEAIDAELQLIGKNKQPKATMEDKRVFYGMLEYYRRTKGYAEGYSSHKFREKFGVWPNSFKNQGPIKPDITFKNWMRHLAIKWRKEQDKNEAA